jgi:hypothetical protein
MIDAVRRSTGSAMRQGFASGLRAEIGRLRLVVARRWAARGVKGYLVTATVVALIVLMWVLDHTSARTVVATCCGEQVGAPVGVGLLKLPGSLVAPAALLPVWGSVVQVVLAFGLAEATVGALRTLTVAAVSHVAATAAGRYFVWYAPVALGGLPPSWRNALDTGPSAATVGVGVYLAIVLGCGRIGGALVLAIAIAFAARSDLAGREHLVAMAVGAGCAGVQLLGYRWSARTADVPAVQREPSVSS